MNITEIIAKQKRAEKSPNTPERFSLWTHYKGEVYMVEGISMREEDKEIMVNYNRVHSPMPIPWSRPLREWNQMVQYSGQTVPRFEKRSGAKYSFARGFSVIVGILLMSLWVLYLVAQFGIFFVHYQDWKKIVRK